MLTAEHIKSLGPRAGINKLKRDLENLRKFPGAVLRIRILFFKAPDQDPGGHDSSRIQIRINCIEACSLIQITITIVFQICLRKSGFLKIRILTLKISGTDSCIMVPSATLYKLKWIRRSKAFPEAMVPYSFFTFGIRS